MNKDRTKNYLSLLLIKLILAFSSIVYELLLAQSLSAFLENTVLRYSVTMGLYLFSMGCGALFAEGKRVARPLITLLQIETALIVFGAGSVVFLHALNISGLSRPLFSLAAHLLIVLVGVLTGFELPLMMLIPRHEEEKFGDRLLGADYFGAFLGTLFFAFLFYPRLGLMPSAFFTGGLNALAALLLWKEKDPLQQKSFYRWWAIQAVLFTVMMVLLGYAAKINEFFITRYAGG